MSGEFLAERTVQGLKALDDHGRNILQKVKVGEVIQCEVNKPRNLAHHRKFWALLNKVWEAAGDWSSPYSLLIELKVNLGMITGAEVRSTGQVVHVLKSISFASMDQTEFDTFYERALMELCKMAGGIEPAELRQAVLEELARA